MTLTKLSSDNFWPYCEKLSKLEKGDSIAVDENNSPIIIHGIQEPLSERELKGASKKLVKVCADVFLTSNTEQLELGIEALKKLKKFYRDVPAVRRKFRPAISQFSALLDFRKTQNITEPLVSLYQKGEKRGNPVAQYLLGGLYMTGRGVEKDVKQSEYYLQLAADKGHARAQTMLGLKYENEDPKRANHWYQLAAAQGEKIAEYKLAVFYFNGIGVDKDEKKGLTILESAAQSFPPAQHYLGLFYKDGYLVAKDPQRAAALFTLAAKANLSDALYELGRCYLRKFGVNFDPIQALEFLQRAIDSGNKDAPGLLPEALCLAGKSCRATDPAKGWGYIQRAAALGDADAEYELYFAHKYGTFLELDEEKALSYLKSAAEKRHVIALAMLAKHYMKTGEKRLAMEYSALALHRGAVTELKSLAKFYKKNELDLARTEQYSHTIRPILTKKSPANA